MKLVDFDKAVPGRTFSFTVDATETGGLGNVVLDIVHDKQSIPHFLHESSRMKFRVSFVPRVNGKYRVYVYFNGSDVRGSPFLIRVGTQRGDSVNGTLRRSSKNSSNYAESLEKNVAISSLDRRLNGLNRSNNFRDQSPVSFANNRSSGSSVNSNINKSNSSSFTDLYDKILPQSPKIHQQQQQQRHNLNQRSSSMKLTSDERRDRSSSSSFIGQQQRRYGSASPVYPWTSNNNYSRTLESNNHRNKESNNNSGYRRNFNKSDSSFVKSKEHDYDYQSKETSFENGIIDTTSNVKGRFIFTNFILSW